MIVEHWAVELTPRDSTIVIPDGCSDFIVCQSEGGSPDWFISELDATARRVAYSTNTTLFGWRLAPGAIVTGDLRRAIAGCDLGDHDEIKSILCSNVLLPRDIEEALETIRLLQHVERAAKSLGVSTRTLQRLVKTRTGRNPKFWCQLSQVRAAGRLLCYGTDIAEAAARCGFADQSHLTRATKQWLGTTPKRLTIDREIIERLSDAGYGDG